MLCENPIVCNHGLCYTHFLQWQRGDVTPEQNEYIISQQKIIIHEPITEVKPGCLEISKFKRNSGQIWEIFKNQFSAFLIINRGAIKYKHYKNAGPSIKEKRPKRKTLTGNPGYDILFLLQYSFFGYCDVVRVDGDASTHFLCKKIRPHSCDLTTIIKRKPSYGINKPFLFPIWLHFDYCNQIAIWKPA